MSLAVFALIVTGLAGLASPVLLKQVGASADVTAVVTVVALLAFGLSVFGVLETHRRRDPGGSAEPRT